MNEAEKHLRLEILIRQQQFWYRDTLEGKISSKLLNDEMNNLKKELVVTDERIFLENCESVRQRIST